MPWRAPRPCGHVGCPNRVTGRRYCPDHAGDELRAREAYDRHRGSARDRGYTARWDKLSELKLRTDPLCELGERAGLPELVHDRPVPAVLVDHVHEIEDGGEVFAWDNLASSCTDCHAIKTAEMARRRAARQVC